MQREKDTTGAWRQVLFGSRPNSKSERNYPSYFGEAFNVINAINSCRMYLEASKETIVMTDHHSVTKLFTQKHLSAFQIRLVNSIADVPNLKLIHRPGEYARIAIVDRLSRAHLDPASTTDFREMFTKREDSKVNVVTRAAKLEAKKNKSADNLPEKDTKFWKERQSENQDITEAICWLKDGAPTKNEFKSNSQLLRGLFHNREALLMMNGVLQRLDHRPTGSTTATSLPVTRPSRTQRHRQDNKHNLDELLDDRIVEGSGNLRRNLQRLPKEKNTTD